MSVADIPAAPPATGFARRHAWLAVLVVGAALFIAEERTLVATQKPNLVPSAILLGASIVPLAFVAFVYGRRLPYRVPGIAVAASAFLGGVIGTIVAATLEFDVLRDLGGLPMLGVGLIEETSKLLVPLALLIPLRRHLRRLLPRSAHPRRESVLAARGSPRLRASPRWRPWATRSRR